MDIPKTRYARSPDGTFIAYQAVGEGPVDVVFVPGFIWHLEIAWELPAMARTYEAFARIGRLILFDKRGTGLSIDGKAGGLAVTIGARVAATAGPSEVLVSQTVKDLVAGSGLTFEGAGEHELKGVLDRWHLYRAVPA